MEVSAPLPWGLTKVTARLPMALSIHTRPQLDPATQTVRHLDEHGKPIDFGKHGTNTANATTSFSGGGDGNKPQPQTADDSNTDYTPD